MPTNHTENYQLSQWVKSDQVQMEDFNADNAKIDGALKAQADALAAHGEVLAGLSNCRVHFTSYVGNGVCDLAHSPRIELPAVPRVLIVVNSYYLMYHMPEMDSHGTILGQSNSNFMGIAWEGTTAVLEQYTSNSSAMMNQARKYYVIAIYSAQ